MTSLSIEVKLE